MLSQTNLIVIDGCNKWKQLNSLWSSLPDSPPHDVSYIFNKREIWTTG